MENIKLITQQVEWAAHNTAYNLDFIPDDKLAWKPAPTANSAYEIVLHIAIAFHWLGGSVRQALGTETTEAVPETAPTSREEAKEMILKPAREYNALIQTLQPEDLEKKIDSGFGVFPLSFLITMPMIDIIHHHGQIAYIQTLLGDTESHFDMALLPQ